MTLTMTPEQRARWDDVGRLGTRLRLCGPAGSLAHSIGLAILKASFRHGTDPLALLRDVIAAIDAVGIERLGLSRGPCRNGPDGVAALVERLRPHSANTGGRQ